MPSRGAKKRRGRRGKKITDEDIKRGIKVGEASPPTARAAPAFVSPDASEGGEAEGPDGVEAAEADSSCTRSVWDIAIKIWVLSSLCRTVRWVWGESK